ncbi:hypothetical protein B0H21DRAFT_764577, partial [Amylocystis lapponica]
MPTFPMEVFERIIDNIGADDCDVEQWFPDTSFERHRHFLSCALTCLPRSRFHIFRVIYLISSTQLHRLLTLEPIHENLVRELVVYHMHHPHTVTYRPHQPWSSFPFTILLKAFHPTSLMALATFTSVTELVLERVNFESFNSFVPLICALPSITILVLERVFFQNQDRIVFGPREVKHGPKLVSLRLLIPAEQYPVDLIQWMVDSQLLSQLTTFSVDIDPSICDCILQVLRGIGNSLHHFKLSIINGEFVVPIRDLRS